MLDFTIKKLTARFIGHKFVFGPPMSTSCPCHVIPGLPHSSTPMYHTEHKGQKKALIILWNGLEQNKMAPSDYFAEWSRLLMY